MRFLANIFFITCFSLNISAQEMYADSLKEGRQYYFTLQEDSLTQQVIIKPIGDFKIHYRIWVGSADSPGYFVEGIANQTGALNSSDGNIWFYTSEDASLELYIYGNGAEEIELYQRPLLEKRIRRSDPPNPSPILDK